MNFLITKTELGKPELFQYMEYRTFLADYFEWRQQENSRFSKRAFSQKYFGSTAILYTVIQGRRDLGPKLRGRCAAALGMGEKENQFFDLLVQHNQAKSELERNFLFDKLSKFRHSKAWVVRENQHRYYSKWYYAVVFNYLGLDHKKAIPAEIAKEIYPPLKVEQVQEAIDLLLELELVKKSDHGYTLTKNHLVSGNAFNGDVALQYNLQIHGISTDMVKDGFRKFKSYNTQVITTSNASLISIREKLTAFQDEIKEIVTKDKNTDQVCTMVFQIIPNTR